jgi:hypothetical protein
MGKAAERKFTDAQLDARTEELRRDGICTLPALFSDDVVTPLHALAVNVPLCDVGPENGPLEMARGTHLLSREVALAKIAAGELVLESFPMKAGDVSVRTPLALHRGTPNRTDRPRPMVVLGYVRHALAAHAQGRAPRTARLLRVAAPRVARALALRRGRPPVRVGGRSVRAVRVLTPCRNQ